MRVSLAEVREVFDRLLAGQSREAASSWAMERLQAVDASSLTYEPLADKDRIWEALTFLVGVDMITDVAGSYLYGLPDFEHYRP